MTAAMTSEEDNAPGPSRRCRERAPPPPEIALTDFSVVVLTIPDTPLAGVAIAGSAPRFIAARASRYEACEDQDQPAQTYTKLT